jgi:hypothetical protein
MHGDAAIMSGTLINAFPPDGGAARPHQELAAGEAQAGSYTTSARARGLPLR